MTCPNLFFTHQSPNGQGIVFSSDITITQSPIQDGATTTICVTVHNSSNFTGTAVIALYWAGLGKHSIDALTRIIAVPILQPQIPANGSATLTFSWQPDSSVKSDMAHFNELVLFAQVTPAVVDGANPCSGPSGPLDFNPSSTYNAAEFFYFNPLPFGESQLLDTSFAALVAAEATLAATTLAMDVALQSVKFARETTFELVALIKREDDDPAFGGGLTGRARTLDDAMAPLST